MITVTCLWGDTIELPDDFDVTQLPQYLTDFRDWDPYDVVVVLYPTPSPDEKEYVAYMVDRNDCVRLSATVPHAETCLGKSWLRTCSHPFILSMFLRQNNILSPVYANPDPLVVDNILLLIADKGVIPAHLSSNPSDKIIDLLQKHPEFIDWSELCRNRNPRVSTLIIDAFRREDTRLVLSDAAAVEHYEVIDFMYEMFQAKLLGLRTWRMNTSPRALDILIDLFDYIPPNRLEDVLRNFARSHHLPAIVHYISYHGRKGGRIYDELWTNTHDRAVEYCLNQSRIQHLLFCTNSNDFAVQFYETHPEHIVWPEYLSNPHPVSVRRGIDWLKEHPHTHRVVNELVKNTNPDMVRFAINEIGHLNLSLKLEMLANCSEIIHVLEK